MIWFSLWKLRDLLSRLLGVGNTGWEELLADYNNSKCHLNRDRACTIEGFCLRCGVNEFFFELTGWILLVIARAIHHFVHLTKLKTPIAIRNSVLAKLQFEGVVLLFPVLLISALWLARFTYFQAAHVMNLEHRYI